MILEVNADCHKLSVLLWLPDLFTVTTVLFVLLRIVTSHSRGYLRSITSVMFHNGTILSVCVVT